MRFVRRWAIVAGLLGGPILLLVALRVFPRLDLQWFSAEGHLIAVSAVAVCALAAASAATVTAVRSGQASVVWLGIGCSAVGLCMLAHGLTTPGVFGRPMNAWVGRLPCLAMLLFAAALAAAGRPPTSPVNRVVQRHPVAFAGTAIAVLTGLVTVVSVDPLLLGGGRSYPWEENVMDAFSLVAVVVLSVVTRTHWRRWHLGHDIVQFALVLTAAASVATVVAFEHGKFGRVSWWDYHGYLFAGFGGAVYAVYCRRREHGALSEILNTAFVDDPFDHIVSGYPDALRSLVRAVEIKDAYTHGHSERTARLAVEIGLTMGLPPDRLRIIARGAYLHDVGKIGIPDGILNKPGKLDDEEWRIIQTHPQLGYELAASAPSLTEALPVILHHHERMDGQGYPAGLCGTDIPLEARVVAVADVWDALTSDRAYRRGWAPTEALAHIRDGAGSHFDPAVVRALTRVVGKWGIVRADGVGDAGVAWEAAETCHEIDKQPAFA